MKCFVCMICSILVNKQFDNIIATDFHHKKDSVGLLQTFHSLSYFLLPSVPRTAYAKPIACLHAPSKILQYSKLVDRSDEVGVSPVDATRLQMARGVYAPYAKSFAAETGPETEYIKWNWMLDWSNIK